MNARNDHMAMFHQMLRIRLVDQGIADRYKEQEMRCPVHLSIGQEAVAVGVCAALTEADRVFSTHRCHAHYLAKGGDLTKMLAEIYGKATGCVGGRGGSMHLSDDAVSMHMSIPIIGSSIPLAVGTAMVDKAAGNARVSVAFFGDAALEEGVFHECANFAVLHSLPIIFVCENNFFSVYSDLAQRQPDRPMTAVGAAHGLAAAAGDGNDVLAVFETAAEAVSRARAGKGPSLLVFDTYRWHEHCGPQIDDHLGYRPKEDVEAWRARCPVEAFRQSLLRAGELDEEQETKIRDDLMREIDDAFDAAKQAPLPDPDTAGLYVYA